MWPIETKRSSIRNGKRFLQISFNNKVVKKEFTSVIEKRKNVFTNLVFLSANLALSRSSACFLSIPTPPTSSKIFSSCKLFGSDLNRLTLVRRHTFSSISSVNGNNSHCNTSGHFFYASYINYHDIAILILITASSTWSSKIAGIVRCIWCARRLLLKASHVT